MATLRSRPWSDFNTGHGHEARSSSCACKPSYKLNVMKNQRFGTAWLAQRSRKRYLVAQGYSSESREAYVISDQDKKFVNALREVQPYIFLNRGRTFVVVVAGEIVACPYFDSILQFREQVYELDHDECPYEMMARELMSQKKNPNTVRLARSSRLYLNGMEKLIDEKNEKMGDKNFKVSLVEQRSHLLVEFILTPIDVLSPHGFDLDEEDIIIEDIYVDFDSGSTSQVSDLGIDLLGVLIADIEPNINVKAVLQSQWKTFGQIRIARAKPNTYVISVGTEQLARRLFEGGPWDVKGYCFSVRVWPSNTALDEICINRATYWVQGHAVPKEQITAENGVKMAKLLGVIEEIEDPAIVGNRGYLRVKVLINTKRPLTTSLMLPRSGGAPTKIKLKYEKLKIFCFKCGRLGHLAMACNRSVNPERIRRGIVYNNDLVAVAPQ
ncbi:hypothetical protein ACLB2K_001457 [Fragaria x ananassa]